MERKSSHCVVALVKHKHGVIRPTARLRRLEDVMAFEIESSSHSGKGAKFAGSCLGDAAAKAVLGKKDAP